jgi:hypothetical protein
MTAICSRAPTLSDWNGGDVPLSVEIRGTDAAV